VVDHELRRRERVDPRRVAAELDDGLAHGREVDDAGHAGEVLHEHAGGGELDLGVRLGAGVPARQCADVLGGDVLAVLRAQEVLEQDLEGVRQALGALDGRQPVDVVRLVADLEPTLAAEAVHAHGASSSNGTILHPT
jgi:hypothetical protein